MQKILLALHPIHSEIYIRNQKSNRPLYNSLDKLERNQNGFKKNQKYKRVIKQIQLMRFKVLFIRGFVFLKSLGLFQQARISVLKALRVLVLILIIIQYKEQHKSSSRIVLVQGILYSLNLVCNVDQICMHVCKKKANNWLEIACRTCNYSNAPRV